MFFISNSQGRVGRRQFVFRAAMFAATLLTGVAVLSGCGGGGSDDNGGGGNPTGGTVTVRGRLIENNTSDNVSGAVVRFASLAVTTGADGQFSFAVPTGTATTNITVTSPVDDKGQPLYYKFAYFRGDQIDDMTNVGGAISGDELKEARTVNVGDVKLFSQALPPPPPPL